MPDDIALVPDTVAGDRKVSPRDVGYALTFDVRNVALAVEDRDQSMESRALVNAFVTSGRVKIAPVEQADAILDGTITAYRLGRSAFRHTPRVRYYWDRFTRRFLMPDKFPSGQSTYGTITPDSPEYYSDLGHLLQTTA